MTQRLNFYGADQKLIQPLLAIEALIKEGPLEERLALLLKMRASQINGCAYCLHMHSADARNAGESEARLYLLDAWHESDLYTPRERAALAWTESLTRVSETHAPDADFELVRSQFNDEELIHLSLLISNINTWNRLSIGFRAQHPSDRMKQAA